MGVYDTIEIDTECPKCEKINYNAQTKDLGNCLESYEIGDEVGSRFRFIEAYQLCDECFSFYQFNVKVDHFGLLTCEYEIKD